MHEIDALVHIGFTQPVAQFFFKDWTRQGLHLEASSSKRPEAPFIKFAKRHTLRRLHTKFTIRTIDQAQRALTLLGISNQMQNDLFSLPEYVQIVKTNGLESGLLKALEDKEVEWDEEERVREIREEREYELFRLEAQRELRHLSMERSPEIMERVKTVEREPMPVLPLKRAGGDLYQRRVKRRMDLGRELCASPKQEETTKPEARSQPSPVTQYYACTSCLGI